MLLENNQVENKSLNLEQKLSIKIEKDVAKHYHVNTKTSFWLGKASKKKKVWQMSHPRGGGG